MWNLILCGSQPTFDPRLTNPVNLAGDDLVLNPQLVNKEDGPTDSFCEMHNDCSGGVL